MAGLLDDYVAAVSNQQQPAQPRRLLDTYVNAIETDRLRSLIVQARASEPDQYARARALAGGIPPEIAVNHLERLEEQELIRGYLGFFEQNPRLRAWVMTDAEALRLIKPDEFRNISLLGGLFEAPAEGVRIGQQQLERSALGFAALTGREQPGDAARLAALDAVEPRRYANFILEGLNLAGQQAPQLLHNAIAGVQAAATAAVVGAGLGAAFGGLPGAAAGATRMAVPAFVLGASMDVYNLAAGNLFLEYRSFRDEQGQPIDQDVARAAAYIGASFIAGLELTGLKVILQNIPGADRLLDSLASGGMEVALRNPSVRGALAGFAQRAGMIGGAEVATEVLQEFVTIGIGEMAKAMSGQDIAPISGNEFGARLSETLETMTNMMLVVGPVLALPGVGRDLRAARQSVEVNEQIRAAAELLAGNPAIQRDPVRAAAAINAQTLNQQVFLQLEELEEFYQEAGVDINTASTAPNWRETLTQARNGDGTIQMSLGDFIAHLAKDPTDNPILDLVRGVPNGFAPGEIRQLANAYSNLLRGTPLQRTEGAPGAAPVEPPRELSAQAIAIQEQFEAAAMSPEAAKSYAELLDAFVNTMSERIGWKPEDMWERIALRVERAAQTNELDALLQTAYHGTWRKGIERFSTQYMGTGEGAQAFGWGMYFAGDSGVARNYQDVISLKRDNPTLEIVSPEGVVQTITQADSPELVRFMASNAGADYLTILDQIITRIETRIEELQSVVAAEKTGVATLSGAAKRLLNAETDLLNTRELRDQVEQVLGVNNKVTLKRNTGAFYEVEVPEDDVLLDWDAYESQQPPLVKEVMEKLAGQYPGMDFETGSEFYYALATELSAEHYKNALEGAPTINGEQAASELLNSLGIPGHRFLDGNSRRKGRGNYNYVIYADEGVSVVGEFMQDARGSIRFTQDGALIKLFAKADLSTVLHEFGHLFFQTYVDLAKDNPTLVADLDILRKQFGFTDFLYDRKAHEKFARAFENYLMKGEAPSRELQGIFNRFRSWLLAIYLRLKNRLPRVTPEMKEVFDRMLASERQIKAKSELREYELRTMEELGLDEEAYKVYSNHVTELRNQAQNNLHRAYVGDANRWFEGWMAKVYEEIQKEVTDGLLKEGSPYYAMQLKAKQPDGDPETIAGIAGFASAEAMEAAIAAAPPMLEAVAERARELMRERHGMGNLDRAEMLDALALSAMHTDARTTVLGTELQALWRRGGKEMPENAVQLASELAKKTVRNDRIGTILSGYKYLSAYQRASRAADRAVLKGDFELAARFKRRQLIAQEMIREANEVRKEIEKARKKALRFSNPKRAPKDVHPDYVDQIRALVAKFDFTADARKGAPKVPLTDFIKDKETEGALFDLDPVAVSGKPTIGFAQLTLEEFEAVLGAIESIEHNGRREEQVRIEGELKAKEAAFQEIRDVLAGHKVAFSQPGPVRRFVNHAAGLLAKAESVVSFLDRGDVNGPFHKLFMRPIQEAQARANTENAAFLKPMFELLQKAGLAHWKQKETISSLPPVGGKPQMMTRNEMMMAVLISGTNAGAERLSKLGYTEAVMNEIIAKTKPEDIDRANQIWALLAPYQEKINQRMARITGVKPKSIQALSRGPLTGGWVPLTEDYTKQRGVSSRTGQPILDDAAIMSALQMKQAETDTQLVLDLNSLTNRMHDIIWSINFREPLKQARALLGDKPIAAMLERVVGRGMVKALDGYVQYLGNQIIHEPLSVWASRISDHLRIGTAAMSLAFNLTTVFLQPLGFFNSVEQVGVKAVARGHKLLIRPGGITEMQRLSEFMSTRANNVERDLQAQYSRALRGKFGNVSHRALQFGYSWLQYMDSYVAGATWWGAFDQALNKKKMSEADAVFFADQTVRLSQGSAAPADLAAAVRLPGVWKWFTMYFTWLSAMWNQVYALTRDTKNTDLRGLPHILARWTGLVIIPAVAMTAYNNLRFEDDEDDEEWVTDYLFNIAAFPLAGIPGVRSIASIWDGFPTALSPVEKSMESFARAVGITVGAIAGDDDPNWRQAYGGAVQTVGTLTHFPLRWLRNIGMDWFERAEEGEENLFKTIGAGFL